MQTAKSYYFLTEADTSENGMFFTEKPNSGYICKKTANMTINLRFFRLFGISKTVTVSSKAKRKPVVGTLTDGTVADYFRSGKTPGKKILGTDVFDIIAEFQIMCERVSSGTFFVTV